MVGAGHDNASHALVERELKDALGHIDVTPLGLVLAGPPIFGRSWPAVVAEVDDRVATRKVGPQGRVVRFDQVGDLNAFDGLAVPIGRSDVDQPQLVALAKHGQELRGDVAGGAGQQDCRPLDLSHVKPPLPSYQGSQDDKNVLRMTNAPGRRLTRRSELVRWALWRSPIWRPCSIHAR